METIWSKKNRAIRNLKKFAQLIANPIVRVAGDLKLDVVNLGITHD